MTNASNHAHDAKQVPELARGPGRRPSLALKPTAIAGLLAFSVLAAGCGSNGPGSVGSGSTKTQLRAYARCMRSHGVSDFPDPTPVPGGGFAFQMNAGPGSDLNHNDPTFKAANQACRALEPGGQRSAPPRAANIAAGLRWARCLRSHGVPSFPDPTSQGAFDSSKFDDSSPAFQTASRACKSAQPTGPVSAVPGPGPGAPARRLHFSRAIVPTGREPAMPIGTWRSRQPPRPPGRDGRTLNANEIVGGRPDSRCPVGRT